MTGPIVFGLAGRGWRLENINAHQPGIGLRGGRDDGSGAWIYGQWEDLCD
jgi:hypothetical protein